MNPGVTALFVRSLREEYRKPATYIARFVMITLILLMLLATRQQYRWGGGAPGLAVFQSVTMLNLLFIGLIGLSYFASAITEEKEDGTLGLLRMTNMSPLSILLGKSTSRLIAFLILLATQLPFVSLAVALGGVSLKQIFSCYAILGAFTFLLGNLTLLFSVIFRRTSMVVTVTVAVLLVLIFGVPILGAFFRELIGTDLGFGTLGKWIIAISPTTGLAQVSELQFDEGVFMQPLSNFVIGVVLFLISWAVFDVFNQGEGRGATPGASRKSTLKSTSPPKWWQTSPQHQLRDHLERVLFPIRRRHSTLDESPLHAGRLWRHCRNHRRYRHVSYSRSKQRSLHYNRPVHSNHHLGSSARYRLQARTPASNVVFPHAHTEIHSTYCLRETDRFGRRYSSRVARRWVRLPTHYRTLRARVSANRNIFSIHLRHCLVSLHLPHDRLPVTLAALGSYSHHLGRQLHSTDPHDPHDGPYGHGGLV